MFPVLSGELSQKFTEHSPNWTVILCPFKFQSQAVTQSTIAEENMSQAGHKPNGKMVKIDISGKKVFVWL